MVLRMSIIKIAGKILECLLCHKHNVCCPTPVGWVLLFLFMFRITETLKPTLICQRPHRVSQISYILKPVLFSAHKLGHVSVFSCLKCAWGQLVCWHPHLYSLETGNCFQLHFPEYRWGVDLYLSVFNLIFLTQYSSYLDRVWHTMAICWSFNFSFCFLKIKNMDQWSRYPEADAFIKMSHTIK
jgi:hypothetical protein